MSDSNSQPLNPNRRKVLGKIFAGGAALATGTRKCILLGT
jgi:hypothetical protein